MNEETKKMALTIAGWMKEFPIEWIQHAYNSTVGEWSRSPLGVCEFLAELRRDLEDGNYD